MPHVPVLCEEVVRLIDPQPGGTYVDGTFGAGGYSRALLDAADCRVVGIDRDPRAVRAAQALQAGLAGRLTVIEGRFGDMVGLLEAQGVAAVDGVALDLGVSSMQIDTAERGFSFRHDGPLDMRMSADGASAADVVNSADEGELADILYDYGEERQSRRIARAIVRARAGKRIERTGELADIVRRALGPAAARDKIDPATRTFQALRIHVNDELGELRRGLAAADTLLAPGGRLAVVSFHSLEDRTVKDFLRARAGEGPRPSRHAPAARRDDDMPGATWRVVTRRPVTPGDAECAANPRARSARLRVGEKLAVAAAGGAA
ncbi:16S rRNA (cytosine(1402)-N(4))-methyltransferase RsmH [Vineibacter terrae]|uniref:Ribosomal RNA small subunit methyltransferase H n=2 Tax=Vineibacter terrae TaxID=2586908 RepID=A0A5C8PJD2_9HYPH|nr:16S rRNA (cytosine(1402)-N(4))-methyltransferase RsmH [Vineibacter terrae]